LAIGPRGSVVLLIGLLLAMPVAFGIHDLSTTGSLTRLGNNLVDGVSNGAIWALIALGYTMVYGIVELINFAHGEVFMIGSLVAFAFWTAIGLGLATAAPLLIGGLLLTAVIAAIASGTLNTMIERAGYRPLRDAPKLATLITAACGSVAPRRASRT
jgi:branched-chain amino acid transport system permease protein